MSTTTALFVAKDSVTFTLNKADLTENEVGDAFETQKRAVPRSDGLQWWIRWYPAGDDKDAKGHVSAFLWVSKPVVAKCTFGVDGTWISETCTYEFVDTSEGFGWGDFASHKRLRPYFRDGKLKFTCSIEFDIKALVISSPPNFNLFQHVPTDAEFVIGSERVPAHKNFLAMISPVFQAMFTHNTAESKSSRIKITEFSIDTVKAAIDFCYGHGLKVRSVEAAVDILRFCDKYFITAVINEIEKSSLLNPSIPTFCTVIQYAYDCNKDSLLAECYNFFEDNQDEITATQQFAELPPSVAVTVVKSAFELETDFEVLRHAHDNGIDFVVDHLERPLIDSMTLDNFCPAVNFAWECSRDELKKVCAAFVNDHQSEVMMFEDFFELPAECLKGVLKLSYDLQGSNE